ncbi:hypothetical protein LXA43DRAFT_1103926 [Ganoderma leucocontextum]|nr:hypothetical protein LXA43DRAFT_1103926 [Ganoderma leucocontextum]
MASPVDPSTSTTSRLSAKAILRLSHLGISNLVLTPIMSGDVVPDIERVLQQDNLASTGFPPTPKVVLVQFSLPGAHINDGVPAKDVAMRDVRRRIVFLNPATRNAA